MKNRLMPIAFIVGMLLLLGPWLLLENPSKYWLIVSAAGGVLTSLTGYNSQAKMMGRGEPGEDLLQSCWSGFKNWLTRKEK